MYHKMKELNTNIDLSKCKVFNLSEYNNEKLAYKETKGKNQDAFCCWDEELDETFDHILIFKKEIKVLHEHIYGPDNNYSDMYYDSLNDDEINYLKYCNMI